MTPLVDEAALEQVVRMPSATDRQRAPCGAAVGHEFGWSPSTSGVIVNVSTNASTAVVILRNLSINGGGNGTNGINWIAGNTLVVENVTISGFTNNDVFDNQTGFACGTAPTSVVGGVTVTTAIASAGNNRKGNNVGGGLPACAPGTALVVQ